MFVRLLCMLLLAAAAVGLIVPAPAHAQAEEAAVAEEAHGMSVDLAWVTVLVFLAMVVVLLMFAAKPIRTGLDSREKHIGEQLDEAERRNREAEELLKKHQAQLATASEQIKQMLEEARKSADALREQETTRTREAVQRERDRAVAEIDAAKGRALQEVANRAADTAINLAGRIVRAELNQNDHAALVAQAIDQFPGGNHG